MVLASAYPKANETSFFFFAYSQAFLEPVG